VTDYASSVMPAGKRKSIYHIPARFLFSQRFAALLLDSWMECKVLILSSDGHRYTLLVQWWDTNSHFSLNEKEEKNKCSDHYTCWNLCKRKWTGSNLRKQFPQLSAQAPNCLWWYHIRKHIPLSLTISHQETYTLRCIVHNALCHTETFLWLAQ
jgi:hypothetical protein